MTSGDGGPSHRVFVTRGDDKSLNIGENVNVSGIFCFGAEKCLCSIPRKVCFNRNPG